MEAAWDVAKTAGMSFEDYVDAMRLASIPDEEFEKLVESDPPPSVAELSMLGRRQLAQDDDRATRKGSRWLTEEGQERWRQPPNSRGRRQWRWRAW